MLTRKRCPACRKSLPVAAFNGSVRSLDGFARTCRACINARRRQRDCSREGRPEPASASARLAAALRQGDIEIVRKLVGAGLIPHWSWVCEAMRGGHLALAEALLACGVERNVFSMAAMGEVARLKRRLGRVPTDARLAASVEPASKQVTPLHVACASDWWSHSPDRISAQVDVAEALRERGADLNASARYRGIADATPLFCACWTSRNLALVRWLIDHGAIPRGGELMAALGHFQRHGREAFDIAELLLAFGQPIDGGVPGARTPLQAFAFQGTHRTVAWLIAHGADVNARGPGGRTAVHFASQRNTVPKTLALLVEHGADLAARDAEGLAALEIAKHNGKTRLVEWIRSRIRTTGE